MARTLRLVKSRTRNCPGPAAAGHHVLVVRRTGHMPAVLAGRPGSHAPAGAWHRWLRILAKVKRWQSATEQCQSGSIGRPPCGRRSPPSVPPDAPVPEAGSGLDESPRRRRCLAAFGEDQLAVPRSSAQNFLDSKKTGTMRMTAALRSSQH